jgi:hypothetical protein
MDKVDTLCDKDRILMEDFSRQSMNRMSSHATLLTSLPFFSVYQDANVKKEVDKDRLIITEVAGAFVSNRPVCDLDLEEIFEKTKEVDKVFLNRLLIPPFTLSVRYSDFADIRIQRIWVIAKTVYGLLEHWPENASFIDAVRNTYSEKKFKDILSEVLHLYNEETRMLSGSIRNLGPLRSVVSTYNNELYQAMEDVKEDITVSAIQRIFGDRTVYA